MLCTNSTESKHANHYDRDKVTQSYQKEALGFWTCKKIAAKSQQ